MLAKYIHTPVVSLICEKEEYLVEEGDRGNLEFIASVQGLLRATKCLGFLLSCTLVRATAEPSLSQFLLHRL